MNVEVIKALVKEKSGALPMGVDAEELADLSDVLGHSDLRDYMQLCLPLEEYIASDLRVLSLPRIRMEMGESSAPGMYVRPFGYLIIATSIGGNAVCLHSPTGKVVWADYSNFTESLISFRDSATGQWEELFEYTAENVERAMITINTSIESFLVQLLKDELTIPLARLDQ